MFRKMFIGGGHLGFNSSVHSPIKNLVEGGGQPSSCDNSYNEYISERRYVLGGDLVE